MYSIHATKKLRDRVKATVSAPIEAPATTLGNWYANALPWRPQVALFVNETTLLPVFVPLAPGSSLAARFPNQLGHVLTALGIPSEFTDRELLAMENYAWSKTANRSVIGSMNDFALLADHHRHAGEAEDLVALSASLAHTPCSPLYKSHVSPDEEVRALANEQSS